MSADDPTSRGTSGGKYGPSDWDSARKAFANSIMVDTSLSSLAQNLDVSDWPLRGEDETPAKYISLNYTQLTEMPGLAGRPERVTQLITILKETLAFDEPFGEMIGSVESASEKDNPILKNMAKLGIPEDYPMPLVALTVEAREFCTTENLTTLREFALYAQTMAQSVVVSGDFRALLNALSHIDEKTLAMYLPFRPGSKGVHLIEGLALTVRAYPAEIQAGVGREFGARLGAEDAARAAMVNRTDIANTSAILAQHTASYVEYFRADLSALQNQVYDGIPLGRLAAVLNDPLVEGIVTNLLKPYLMLPTPKTPLRTTTPPVEDTDRPRGFWGAIRRLFKK